MLKFMYEKLLKGDKDDIVKLLMIEQIEKTLRKEFNGTTSIEVDNFIMDNFEEYKLTKEILNKELYGNGSYNETN